MVGHTAPAHVLLLLLVVVGTLSPSRAGVFDLGGFRYQWAGFIVVIILFRHLSQNYLTIFHHINALAFASTATQ